MCKLEIEKIFDEILLEHPDRWPEYIKEASRLPGKDVRADFNVELIRRMRELHEAED